MFGFNCSHQNKRKGQVLNFVLSQAKLGVWLSRKRKVNDGAEVDPTVICEELI